MIHFTIDNFYILIQHRFKYIKVITNKIFVSYINTKMADNEQIIFLQNYFNTFDP